jgi:CRISPR-associated protein Cas2
MLYLMKKRALHIAAYDVCDPSRLRRALHVLHDYATGGQKSVFECYLTDAEQSELLERVTEVIDANEDRFVLLRLDPRMALQVTGIAVAPQDPLFYYVG